MIELKQIVKRYKMGGEVINALDRVDLSIADHEFVAIIGPSGSGKSTLMNIVGCLDYPDEGEYLLDGEDVSEFSPRELAVIRNKKIGFIFQQFNLLGKLTAYENVELPLIYQGLSSAERKERVTEALERVGLGERMKHRPNQLSGGQQQRVANAPARSTHPTQINAHEPTRHLATKSGQDIIRMLHELHDQGNAIMLITHDNAISLEAQRRMAIRDGKISLVNGNHDVTKAAEAGEPEREESAS